MNSGFTAHQHKGHTETGPRFKNSFEKPDEREVEPATLMTFQLHPHSYGLLPLIIWVRMAKAQQIFRSGRQPCAEQ